MQDSTQKNTEYITLEEISKELEVSERTVIRWVRNGELRAFKLRNITRIRREDFAAFMEKYMQKGAGG